MSKAFKLPIWVVALLLFAALGISAEALSRWVLGLGTPPLYEADAGFEYRLRPDQDLYRFGNHIVVNRWGMRSDDFGKTKVNPSELRVMVFGDSVVNGGSEVGHQALATTLLQETLQQTLARPVVVGNISAGSWGPGNWLAYAQRFGFFEADLVVLVVGSGDARDNPVFGPLSINQPTEQPALALQEAVLRYLPRYLPEQMTSLLIEQPPLALTSPVTTDANAQDPTERGLDDLRRFLTLASGEGRQVVVFHHPGRSETDSGQMDAGHAEIVTLVQGMGLHLVELREDYRQAREPVYRDAVHLTVSGQRVLASVLQRVAKPMLPRHNLLPVSQSAPSQARS
jgi:lysophospholipase L1-like esterase